MKQLIRDIIIVILVAVCIVTLVKPIIVKKTSMEPTLYENDYLIISKQAYTVFGEPKRGDIVVFPHNTDGVKELYIKRIIGLPGDKITITNGVVIINGEPLNETYTKDGTTPGDVKDFVVPEGRVYVMGDNRIVSVDSRSDEVGCVAIKKITGKAIIRVFPFSKFGSLE
jgi:signal peptidase I